MHELVHNRPPRLAFELSAHPFGIQRYRVSGGIGRHTAHVRISQIPQPNLPWCLEASAGQELHDAGIPFTNHRLQFLCRPFLKLFRLRCVDREPVPLIRRGEPEQTCRRGFNSLQRRRLARDDIDLTEERVAEAIIGIRVLQDKQQVPERLGVAGWQGNPCCHLSARRRLLAAVDAGDQ